MTAAPETRAADEAVEFVLRFARVGHDAGYPARRAPSRLR
jgi:hypothetical protein